MTKNTSKAQTEEARRSSDVYISDYVVPADQASFAGMRKTGLPRKAAFVFTKEEQVSGETETVQLAVVIPRRVSLWFRHYALDQGLSMAELIRRILRNFMATHGEPAE
jgi:hypothetical protein